MVLGPFLVVRPKGQGVWALIPGVPAAADIHPFPIIKSSNIFRHDLERSPLGTPPQTFLPPWGDRYGHTWAISGG